jgi:hypothetical protein
MANEPRIISDVTAKWTAAGTTSDPCGGGLGFSLVGIVFPATGFAGATVTFQSSFDGVTYSPVSYSPGDGTSAVVTVPVVAGGCVGIDPVKTLPFQMLKIVGASSQAAGATLRLVCTPLQ